MMPFDMLFTELASREVGIVYAHQDHRLPDGTYLFREFYCIDTGCDCRRVDLRVFNVETSEQVASLQYVLASAGEAPPSEGRIALDFLNPQTPLSQTLLWVFGQLLEWDPEYATQLAQHHALWRQVVDDPSHPEQEILRAFLRSKPMATAIPSICWLQ